MSYEEIIEEIKPELEKVLSFLDRELAKIRVGQISPALLEDLKIECFGKNFPLKQLATISLSKGNQIIIQPWDKSYIGPIEEAISKSELDISPIIDKDIIRVSFPPLSEEYRKRLVRLLSEKQEEARRTIRRWREEAWRKIQNKFREKEISEDEKYKGKDKLQDVIDDYNNKVKEKIEKKKKELEA